MVLPRNYIWKLYTKWQIFPLESLFPDWEEIWQNTPKELAKFPLEMWIQMGIFQLNASLNWQNAPRFAGNILMEYSIESLFPGAILAKCLL